MEKPMWIVSLRHQYRTSTHRVRAESAAQALDIAIQRRFGRRRHFVQMAPNIPTVGHVYREVRREGALTLDQDGPVHVEVRRV